MVRVDQSMLSSIPLAAEDGDGFIVRLYEAYNQRGKIELRFIGRCSCLGGNLLEENGAALAADGCAIKLDIKPYQVRSLRVRL